MKKDFIKDNIVPILFVVICSLAIPLSGYSFNYLASEVITRISRNSFLILSLLIPILAGMGLNFGMVLGAMAGQIGLILITDWNVVGIWGLLLASILSIPFSVILGYVSGKILNLSKGREMITSYILGFFMNGVYQLAVLYGMGSIFPISKTGLVLSRGYGVRNSVNLVQVRQAFDNALAFNIFGVKIPVLTLLIIALLCFFVIWFRKTKLGQDMRAIAQDMEVARASGINVERTRIIAIIISTVLAGFGMIVYLQNMGTLNTYNSHEQIGMFSIAALLVGGASVKKANIKNVFIGVILFHLMFIISPLAGKNLIGSAQLGEYFRVFVSYGVIALSLSLYAMKKVREKNEHAKALQREQKEIVDAK